MRARGWLGRRGRGPWGLGPKKPTCPPPTLSIYTNKCGGGGRGSFIYRNDSREPGEAPQKQGSSLLLSSLKKKKEEEEGRKKKTEREIGGGCTPHFQLWRRWIHVSSLITPGPGPSVLFTLPRRGRASVATITSTPG